jgi:hypothetical protein
VVQPDGTIIGGHATWQALQRLGWNDVEVRVVAGLTQPQYRALELALGELEDAMRPFPGDMFGGPEPLARARSSGPAATATRIVREEILLIFQWSCGGQIFGQACPFCPSI